MLGFTNRVQGILRDQDSTQTSKPESVDLLHQQRIITGDSASAYIIMRGSELRRFLHTVFDDATFRGKDPRGLQLQDHTKLLKNHCQVLKGDIWHFADATYGIIALLKVEWCRSISKALSVSVFNDEKVFANRPGTPTISVLGYDSLSMTSNQNQRWNTIEAL
jgi:hypothetical protein